ncbi:MAG: hypothetical protein IJ620_00040 [Bacteroidales bacterium]|nr:hypothetical protein [Bacteroidales bacterium]
MLLLFLLSWTGKGWSQECPTAFLDKTTPEYVYTCYHGSNTQREAEQAFMDGLRNNAYGALAHQFQSQVRSIVEREIRETNLETEISAFSQTDMTTDLTLTLAQSKRLYDGKRREGWVIVYINKAEARGYYMGEYNRAMTRIGNAMTNAQAYVARGMKAKARDEELRPVLPEFEKAAEAMAWLDLFAFPTERMEQMLSDYRRQSVAVKQMLADLQNGIAVCLRSSAKVMGQAYVPFDSDVKGRLQPLGCNFVGTTAGADWIVDVQADVNRTVHREGLPYFAYVDGTLTITNGKTHQVVFAGRISQLESGHADGIRGDGDTRSYDPSAHDAYKQAARLVANKTMEIIKQ